MEFRILGMLEVVDAGRPVEVAAAKMRALLAELVLHANQIVSRERLMEVVWGDRPPATATTTLNTYVSHLRAALEPGRAPRSPARVLLTRDPGYLLAVDPAHVDAMRFERLAAEGRRALAAGDAATAAATLREGLALWRGAALADFLYEPFAQAEATRLEELRLTAVEERVDADLALGRHHDLVGELRRLVDEEPLRERLWSQLMLALYRCGRQSEALRAYGDLRRVLGEELGIDPSPALRQLEDDVLHQRPALDVRPAAPPISEPSDPEAPFPRRPGPVPTNLPARLTSFVGREDDIAELRRLCGRARLVTLFGAGGVGKSRLALEVAAGLLEDHPDGVFLVELASLADAGGLHQRVLATLGVGEDHRSDPAETLVGHLADRRVLLLLDNCEHLVDACAALAEDLLASGPGVRILATSREVLRIPPETAWRVPSLTAPPPELSAGELEGFEATRLFVDRARTASPGLELSAAEGRHVARICQRLDGIPLAIELAATRTRLLPVGEIAERLDDRFGLLSAGARTGPRRHQTLRAAVEWSYDSLTVPERRLFDCLSVFSGGFTLEAAESVCNGSTPDRSTVLHTLAGLCDKSMVLVEPGGGRFRLLETLRQYGAERLAESGGHQSAHERHLAWATSMAAEAESRLEGTGQPEWLDHLAVEHDNLRTALGWAARSSDRAGLLSLAASLGRFWEVRGHLSEGRRWLECALEATAAGSPTLRAKAHRWAGVLAQRQGDHHAARDNYVAALALSRDAGDRRGTASALHSLGNLEGLEGRLGAATALYEESLGIGRDLDDRRVVAASLTNLGWITQTVGDFPRARRFTEEALAAWQELGDRQGLAQALTALAYLALLQGDHPAVRSFCAQSLDIQQVLGDRYGEAWSLTYLGWASQNEGDLATARRLHDQVLVVRRQLGDRYGEAWSLSHLGDVERAAGQLEKAHRLLDESLAIARELGDMYCISWSLLRLGKLARCGHDEAAAADLFGQGLAVAGQHGDRLAAAECIEGLAGTIARSPGERELAGRLFGTAHAVREAAGAPVPAADLARYHRDVDGVRHGLGEEAFTAAWEAGRAATVEEVVRRHARSSTDMPRAGDRRRS